MILGHITGKTSTHNFKFDIKGDAKKFDYVQIAHKEHGFVLSQILEIEKTSVDYVASCNAIGFRGKDNVLRGLRTPFEPGTEVLKAEDELLEKVLGLELHKNGAYVGVLDGRDNLKVFLDMEKMLTKHIFITGKSGSGKSYTVSVIIEEIMEKNIPLVIIDPHGEYHTLSDPNFAEKEQLMRFGTKPKGFTGKLQEFSPDIEANPQAKAIRLNGRNLTPNELIQMLPAKLSSAQMGALYSAIKNLGGDANFDDLLFELQTLEESSSKWTLINMLDYIKKLNLFSDTPTLPDELVQPGKCSVLNLRGVPPEVQEVIVYKIVNDLFVERKRGNIPPFFLVVEEAQNFCPERGFGEAKSSPILRQVSAEGRKFGMGLCVISQRPSRLDKSVISQMSTQIIMKITNPNDVRALTSSVEGITFELENELQNIPIGTGLVTGIVDLPLFVNIRPRKTKHGGEAVSMLSTAPTTEETEGNLMLILEPRISAQDMQLIEESPVKISTVLCPASMYRCSQGGDDFSVLVDLNEGKIVTNIDKGMGKPLAGMQVQDLTPQQAKVFQFALKLGTFKAAELFMKSGVQFSDLYDLISVLIKKGYLDQQGDVFSVSSKLKEFSDLQKLACYEKPEFKKVSNAQTMKAEYGQEKVKELLSKFSLVKSAKECWIVKYAKD